MLRFLSLIAGLALGLSGVFPSEMTGKKSSDPDIKGLQQYAESLGVRLLYAESRSILTGARRELIRVKTEDFNAAAAVDVGVALGGHVLEQSPSLKGQPQSRQVGILKEIVTAACVNWLAGEEISKKLRSRYIWKGLCDGFEKPPVLATSSEAEDSFGIDVDLEVSSDEPIEDEGELPTSSAKRDAEVPAEGAAKRPRHEDPRGTKRKRADDDDPRAKKKSRGFGQWLEDRSTDWRILAWLAVQTTVFGWLGMFGPMIVSGGATFLSLLSYLKKLSQEAGIHLLSVSGGVAALAGSFGDSLEDFMGNLLLLMLLVVFWYFAGDRILERVLAWYRSLEGSPGSGTGGALAGAGLGGAGSGVMAGGGEGAAPAEVAPPPVPPGLGVAGAPSASVGDELDDFARRLGLGGSLGSPPLPVQTPESRVLALQAPQGDRWRTWESVLRDSSSPTDPKWSAHLKGSPTVLETFRGYRQAGGPLAHHREWARATGLAGKPHGHEHFTLCCAIEMMACFDQLNCPQLLSAELLMRRLCLIESAYEVGQNGKADFFHAEEMMGFHARASGAVIATTLETEVSERLKARAEIQKQLMKAREVQRGSKKGGGKADA
jgi:hypothetical protein